MCEWDNDVIVGYEFTATCRHGTRSTHNGTILVKNGIFKCSDAWVRMRRVCVVSVGALAVNGIHLGAIWGRSEIDCVRSGLDLDSIWARSEVDWIRSGLDMGSIWAQSGLDLGSI